MGDPPLVFRRCVAGRASTVQRAAATSPSDTLAALRMECPVCGAALPGGAAGDAHVNAHFEAPSGAGAAAASHAPCAVCGVLVAASEAESHAMAHALQASDFAAALRAGGGSAGDAIDLCDDISSDVGAALRGGARRAATPPPRLALSALPGCATAEPLPAVAEGLHALIRNALSAQPAHRGFFRAALAGAPLMHYATAEGLDAGCVPSARRKQGRARAQSRCCSAVFFLR